MRTSKKVLAFIDEVIGEPAYVAGNSLGGYIAANLAANYPRAVLGLALMNATPFWAFRKPNANAVLNGGGVADPSPPTDLSATRDISTGSATSTGIPTDSEIVPGNPATKGESPAEGSGDWLGWDGTLPAPAGLFRFGAWYFDRMRDPRTVKSMLGAVYSNPGKSKHLAISVDEERVVAQLVDVSCGWVCRRWQSAGCFRTHAGGFDFDHSVGGVCCGRKRANRVCVCVFLASTALAG